MKFSTIGLYAFLAFLTLPAYARFSESQLHSKQHSQKCLLFLNFNALGSKILLTNNTLFQGITGFEDLDTLTEEYQGKLVAYEKAQKRLTISFNAATLAQHNMSLQDLYVVFKQAKGEGKYWNTEHPSYIESSQRIKRMWLILTTKATKYLTQLRRNKIIADGLTGIDSVDHLNDINSAKVRDRFSSGQNANTTFIIEFDRAIPESSLNEYRALPEVAKAEAE